MDHQSLLIASRDPRLTGVRIFGPFELNLSAVPELHTYRRSTYVPGCSGIIVLYESRVDASPPRPIPPQHNSPHLHLPLHLQVDYQEGLRPERPPLSHLHT